MTGRSLTKQHGAYPMSSAMIMLDDAIRILEHAGFTATREGDRLVARAKRGSEYYSALLDLTREKEGIVLVSRRWVDAFKK